MLYRIVCVFLVVLISGCVSSGISKSSKFGADSPDGLLVVAVTGESDFEIWFATIDASSKKLTSTSFTGNSGTFHKASPSKEYHVIDFKPGTYVLRSIVSGKTTGRVVDIHTLCLNKDSKMFEIDAAEILYFGHIEISSNGSLNFNQDDFEGAKTALESYANVSGNILPADLTSTSFDDGCGK